MNASVRCISNTDSWIPIAVTPNQPQQNQTNRIHKPDRKQGKRNASSAYLNKNKFRSKRRRRISKECVNFKKSEQMSVQRCAKVFRARYEIRISLDVTTHKHLRMLLATNT